MRSSAAGLRSEVIDRARDWAVATESPSYESEGGVVFFESFSSDGGPAHGNFLTASYRAILADAHWCGRLDKQHAGSRFLPADKKGARETDSCTSSDALLLNVMCHSDSRPMWAQVFGATGPPEFGVGGAVPKLIDGCLRGDESELDMVFRGTRGAISCIVEAKLTETDFTKRDASVVESYAELASVFDVGKLSRAGSGKYDNYQLIRNVLAAHHHRAHFWLICDARRPDLLNRFHETLRAVRRPEVADRCRSVAWQEIGSASCAEVRGFLADKYGIEP